MATKKLARREKPIKRRKSKQPEAEKQPPGGPEIAGIELTTLQQQIGNQAVQRLVVQRGGEEFRRRSPGDQTPPMSVVQRDMPTDVEVEASLQRAGVQRRFPAIHAQLMQLAENRAYLSYEDWRRVTRNQDEAQRLFGQVLNQAWGVIQGEFLNYLIGRVASATVGAVITIISVAEQLIDEARWRRDREYRQNQIYLWLLQQLALRMASAYRGYAVTEWDSGVQSIHQMLLRQTINFRDWYESSEAREFRRRAMEARGERSGVWYMYSGSQ